MLISHFSLSSFECLLSFVLKLRDNMIDIKWQSHHPLVVLDILLCCNTNTVKVHEENFSCQAREPSVSKVRKDPRTR